MFCVKCGGQLQAGQPGTLREHQRLFESGTPPTIWTEEQTGQFAKWRDQAATKAAKTLKTTENQNERN